MPGPSHRSRPPHGPSSPVLPSSAPEGRTRALAASSSLRHGLGLAVLVLGLALLGVGGVAPCLAQEPAQDQAPVDAQPSGESGAAAGPEGGQEGASTGPSSEGTIKTPIQRTLERLGVQGATEGADGEAGAEQGAGQAGTDPAEAESADGGASEVLSQALVEPFEPRTWRDLWEHLRERIIAWLPSLIAAALVLLVFFGLHRLIQGVVHRVMVRTRADPGVHKIASRLLRYFVLGLGVVMAASQVGIEVTSLIAGLGIVGLAVGLAAQDSLANLIAGLTILWDRPFRIGDNVTVAGTFGEVKEIGLRSTRIRTVEQMDAILPNKEIINQKIVNHTLNPMLRLGIPLGIAYKEDSRHAREVLLAAITGHDLLLEKPEPKVVVTALADSAVSLELRVWLRDAHAEREATFEMIELSKIALDEAGIEIPFPQRTLHLASGSMRLDGPPAPVPSEGSEGSGGSEEGSEESEKGGEDTPDARGEDERSGHDRGARDRDGGADALGDGRAAIRRRRRPRRGGDR